MGKTHIVYRFIKGGTENYKNIAPTVGVEFSSKMVTLTGDKCIKVQIWDTGTPLFMQPGKNNTEQSPQRKPLIIQSLSKGPRGIGRLRYHQGSHLQKRQTMDRRNQGTCHRKRSNSYRWQQVRSQIIASRNGGGGEATCQVNGLLLRRDQRHYWRQYRLNL